MPSTARAPSRAIRAVRLVAKLAVAAFGVCFALLLGLRVVVYPQLEAHPGDIARWLGARIGQPVEIDAIVTGWEGWNPRLSIRGFRVRDRAGEATLLELPRVDLQVAWTSLPRLDLRLKELTIDSPRLAVRRDSAGRLHIAGFEWPADDAGDDSGFADWLLRQPQVVVRDALVSWNDELRHAPQLILDHVQFRLVQRGGRHQAGLTGIPPAELAAPIELRADFAAASVKDVDSLAGKLYVRLDYADVGAWREWLPLPFVLASGRGALRLWADFEHGQASAVTADLELADVQASFERDRAPLAIAHLGGRIRWKHAADRDAFEAIRLGLTLADGGNVGPTDIALTLTQPGPTTAGGGRLAFDALALAPLASAVAHLPLPDTLREDIARFAPQGTLRAAHIEWQGDAREPTRYSVRADVDALAIASRGNEPGVTGISGSIAMNQRGGELRVDAARSAVALPVVLTAPLAMEHLRGVVTWQDDDAGTSVTWRDVEFEGADIAGTTGGTWRAQPTGPGTIDMRVQLSRASLADAQRYVPVAAAAALRDWLRRAIVAGTTHDAHLILEGDLARFPFRDGKSGRFELVVKASDAALAYADGWPPITGIAGEVRIDAARVTIDATRGRIGEVAIGATHAEVADFHDAVLRVDGRASGPTHAFLAFVAATPVGGWIGHATDDIRAGGDGRLDLALTLPLHELAKAEVSGRYALARNDVQLPGMPLLANATGELAITQRDVRATAITAQALGGPLKLGFSADAERVHVDASGSVDAAQVQKAFDVPLLSRVQGTTDWTLALDARDRDIAWTVESSLVGASVDLPVPLRKQAPERMPLRIERKTVKAPEDRAAGAARNAAKPQEDRIAIDYGRIAKAVLRRHVVDATPVVDRALVLVGKSAGESAEPAQPGVFIRANVPALNLDDWLDLAAKAPAPGTDGAAVTVNGVDVQAERITAVGRTFADVKASARRRGGEWRLTFDGPELAGTATWRSASTEQPDARLVAHLSRLVSSPSVSGSAADDGPGASTTTHWPVVDLVADNLVRRGRSIGRLEVHAQPSGTDWQIRKLVLANEAGTIEARGSWRTTAAPAQTRIDIVIDVKEAGAFLGRFGWPDAVKGAPTKIEGQVSWTGAPSDFDYPSLAGRFTLRAGAGQFTKLEPGAARLLGILSLQALPRRISLDFRDVFSQGFAFDSIVGNVRMDRGVMHTEDLRLVGPAAAVDLSGDVDLARETQQLQVRVQPSLSTGVSAGAAALFIANPLIGAAVGAGTLLAQKILNNPFDQLFSYRYSVTGTFDDPVVARAGVTATSAESTSTIR